MPTIKYLFSKMMHKIQIPAVIGSDIDSTARICSKSHVFHSSLGAYSYIGNDCKVFSTNIGKFCSIADGCFLGGAQHPIDYVSTSPVFHKGRNIMGVNFAMHNDPATEKIQIGNDVWIGASCLVKSGITIGDGAVVAMGSVVTHDVPAYAIVAGNPARLIRYRFDNTTINMLVQLKWWEWDIEKIKKYAKFFDAPQKLFDSLEY